VSVSLYPQAAPVPVPEPRPAPPPAPAPTPAPEAPAPPPQSQEDPIALAEKEFREAEMSRLLEKKRAERTTDSEFPDIV